MRLAIRPLTPDLRPALEGLFGNGAAMQWLLVRVLADLPRCRKQRAAKALGLQAYVAAGTWPEAHRGSHRDNILSVHKALGDPRM